MIRDGARGGGSSYEIVFECNVCLVHFQLRLLFVSHYWMRKHEKKRLLFPHHLSDFFDCVFFLVCNHIGTSFFFFYFIHPFISSTNNPTETKNEKKKDFSLNQEVGGKGEINCDFSFTTNFDVLVKHVRCINFVNNWENKNMNQTRKNCITCCVSSFV